MHLKNVSRLFVSCAEHSLTVLCIEATVGVEAKLPRPPLHQHHMERLSPDGMSLGYLKD